MSKNLRYLLLTLLCAVVTSAWSADTWVKTDPTKLTTGDVVVIVDLTTSKAMSNNNGTSAAPSAVSVTLNTDKTEISSSPAETLQWVVTVGNGCYQFGVGSNYLYCTNTNNGVRVGTNDNNVFTLSDAGGEHNCRYLLNQATSRYIGVNAETEWRCYTSINNNIKGTETAFFKKVTTQGAVDPSDNITISGTTMEVGETVTISKPGDLAVTYSSNDTDIATVSSNGVVTGVSVGEATITVSWAAVANQYVANSKTFTVTVTPAIARVKFVKLTEANMIAADRDFILVAESNNVAMGTNNTKYRTPVEVTIKNNAVSIEESELTNYAVLNLSSANGGWKIKASDGYYLKASDSANELYAVEENEAGIWTITDDFQLQSGDYYIQYNNGTPRFSCYKNTQKQAVLYIKDGYEPVSTLQASAEISSTELTVGGTANITTDPADLVVTYSSNNENIATVNEGVVTAVAAGTATITVSWNEQTIGEDTYALGSQTFTINVTSNQPATSKTYQKVTSTADLTTGNYLIVYEEGSVAFDGSSTSFDQANNVKSVIITNNTITTDEDIFFTIDVETKTINSASEFYIGVSGYSNGLDYLNSNVNDPFIHNSFEIDENGNAVIGLTIPDKGVMSLKYNKANDQNRFRYYKTGQQSIQLYKEVVEVPEPESVTITISADATDGNDCYATLSALGEGYFTVPADLEVSTLIVNESGKFEYPKNFAEGDAIPGDGAYLLRGAAGEYTFTPTATPAEPVELGLNMLMSTGEGNITVSAPEGELDSDYYFYKLALNSKRTPGSVGFYWGFEGGGTFFYGKAKQCYLAVPRTYVKLGTSALLFDETDGIENATTETRTSETYTLTGVRVSGDRLPSGIYIVNGKKQVVR